jgi:ribonuclease T1
MLRLGAVLATAALLLLGGLVPTSDARDAAAQKLVAVAELPPEARTTLDLIRKGGPFPYQKDGTTFGNFEKRLPLRERGYYREYTVPTPGAKNRGARRIVGGRDGDFWYTDDHYNSFRRIKE